MASKTLRVSSKKGNEIYGESKKHKKIDDFECQNSCSRCDENARKSCPQEINGTLCYSKGCSHEDLFETNNGALCNIGNPCSDLDHEPSDAVQQDQRLQKGTTFQDLYMQGHYDDEDDDDSDWEPVNQFILKKWFCTNCTMPNFDDVCHCDVCVIFSLLFTDAFALIVLDEPYSMYVTCSVYFM